MEEFTLIRDYFAPLSKGFAGGLTLKDDAAILPCKPGQDMIVTKDALTRGVHFVGDEPAAHIAQKALRANLSDLAAMGAEPIAYFLAMMLPKDIKPEWVEDFARGLAADQEQYKIYLAGGDTISTKESLAISVTAIGSVAYKQALKRSTAHVGDMVYVSGTIGDSALGLKLLQGLSPLILSDDEQHFLKERYFLPQPRLSVGRGLVGLASAAMDISDGLVQDLNHICEASGVGARIEQQHIPLSRAAAGLVEEDDALWASILGGGDDYELLFTASADRKFSIQALSSELNIPLTVIGVIEEGDAVTVLDTAGEPMALPQQGYSHFS